MVLVVDRFEWCLQLHDCQFPLLGLELPDLGSSDSGILEGLELNHRGCLACRDTVGCRVICGVCLWHLNHLVAMDLDLVNRLEVSFIAMDKLIVE